VDATDDPVHGQQEGRFFHGYYRQYCYLPLYIFCGEQLLRARLRRADQDGAAGTQEELERIIGRIRRRWPETRIMVRGDAGFCREDLMGWCGAHEVDYVLGLAKNDRLKAAIAAELAEARARYEATGQATRVFKDFCYQTRESWSRERRVIGKAEHLAKGENPRFVVTSLSPERSRHGPCMKSSTAPAARCRIASRNSNWRCSPIAPRSIRLSMPQVGIRNAHVHANSIDKMALCRLR
jgi:hypothetical protein